MVRAAVDSDLPGLALAARHLNTVNLPDDRERLAQSIERSEKAFAGKLEPSRREFLFVMIERNPDGGERVVGAAMIFAQHGSRRSPHVYFDVIDEQRYSETIDRHFHHRVLRIGYNYKGLTEIGGLVVLPELRGHGERLGKQLVSARFLYMGRHRALFCDDILSELLPPLAPDGTSVLWEALGRHFTGLSYQEADRLSRENKEFIRALFPQDPIYVTLLPPEAQAAIGQVGPSSKPVEQMLTRAGFAYAHRIDPFDGGPHFQAKLDQVSAVATTRAVRVQRVLPSAEGEACLVASEKTTRPYFLAVRTHCTLDASGITIGEDAVRALGVSIGDEVSVLSL